MNSESKFTPSTDENAPWIFLEAPGVYFCSTNDSGKWCIVSTSENVDKDWNTVISLIRESKLVAAKVSTLYAKKITGHATHVICVYTKKWEDKEDVFKYRKVLEDAGFTEKMGYKRDIDTLNPNPNFEFYYEA